MTEKIIIDGVNVAGCYLKCEDGDCAVYYADLSTDNNELVYGFNCEDNPNCYYKQLQRAKAENDKFKNFVKDLLFDVSCENWLERFIFSFNDWKKEMVSENEELKAEIEEIKKIKDDFFKQAEISHQAVLDKNKIIEELQAENERLKECLKIINKIAKDTNYNDRIIFLDNMEIIRKLSEAEND